MMNIVFLDRDTLASHVPLLQPAFPHNWQNFPSTQAEDVIERCKNADIIVVNKVQLMREQLLQLPKLKLIAVTATGTNNVDLVTAKERGISVCNIRNYTTQGIAEHCIGLMFALRRNLFAYHQAVQQGRWQQSSQFCFLDYPINNLHGQTLGIIGYGTLGQACGQLASVLGMDVIVAERQGQTPRAGRIALEDVLAQADVISIHSPLTEDTLDLIGSEQLSLMKSSSIIINTARGGIINERALAQALKDGTIAGAASDVCQQEPPQANSPLMQACQLPNFIQTPHVAWASTESLQNLIEQLIENIEMFIAGCPQNIV